MATWTPIGDEMENQTSRLGLKKIYRVIHGSKIPKSQSFKYQSEVVSGSKFLPKVDQGTRFTRQVEDKDKSNLPIGHPIPIKSTLFRAATSRGLSAALNSLRLGTFRKRLARTETSLVPTNSKNEDNSCSNPDLMTLESLQFRIHSGFGLSVINCNLEGLIQHYEERVRHKTKDFPSIRLQQKWAANYTPGWSWIKQVRRLAEEVTKKKTIFDAKDVKHIHDSLDQFLWQVSTCQSILSKIRLNFDCGLDEMDHKTFEDQVTAITKDFRIRRVGERGACIGTIPYIQDIFETEKLKQDKYKKWFCVRKTKLHLSRQRDEVVTWVKKACVTLNYAVETAHLATYFIDAFLSTKENDVTINGYGLLGIVALRIASKLEEIDPVSIKRLIRLSSCRYKIDEINWMESKVLGNLKFDLYPPAAPLFVQMMVLHGSLEFPKSNIQKIVMDLSLGILYESLNNQKLFSVLPMDRAKAALEIATEFTFFQHRLYSRREMGDYDCITGTPGREVGEFATGLCYEMFFQRFRTNNLLTKVPEGVTCAMSPAREVNAN